MKQKYLLTLAASAVLITSASASVTMDWVTVGNPGNAADPLTGYGSVAYEYKIGKYEVTNAQYGAFLNAKAATDSYSLYNSSMSSYGITQSGSSGSYTYSVTTALANRPVVYVSWFDAARMANWMMNGQGSGSTETGAYTRSMARPPVSFWRTLWLKFTSPPKTNGTRRHITMQQTKPTRSTRTDRKRSPRRMLITPIARAPARMSAHTAVIQVPTAPSTKAAMSGNGTTL
jgi:hypothetical protein